VTVSPHAIRDRPELSIIKSCFTKLHGPVFAVADTKFGEVCSIEEVEVDECHEIRGLKGIDCGTRFVMC
jgi:hypothetical protein